MIDKPKHHTTDFHKTLAHYDHENQHAEDFDNMPPITRMVNRVKAWRAKGEKVTVFSAAANPENDWDGRIKRGIGDWTETHIGERLPVTAIKSSDFTDMWDDKGVAVEANTGKRLSKKPKKAKERKASNG
jgi:hypothetical protein